MKIALEDPVPGIKKVLAFLIFTGIITTALGLGFFIKIKAETISIVPKSTFNLKLSTIQGNSLVAISNPVVKSTSEKQEKIKKIEMIVTAYSSDPLQTDNTPFITASGKTVKDGIVANNLLPLGTKIKIPALYGNKIFEVQDRMSRYKSYYHIDIWFPKNSEAKNFGVKKTYIEILES